MRTFNLPSDVIEYLGSMGSPMLYAATDGTKWLSNRVISGKIFEYGGGVPEHVFRSLQRRGQIAPYWPDSPELEAWGLSEAFAPQEPADV